MNLYTECLVVKDLRIRYFLCACYFNWHSRHLSSSKFIRFSKRINKKILIKVGRLPSEIRLIVKKELGTIIPRLLFYEPIP